MVMAATLTLVMVAVMAVMAVAAVVVAADASRAVANSKPLTRRSLQSAGVGAR